MCAIIAQFIRDLLDFVGLSSNLAYITRACLLATSVLTDWFAYQTLRC